jgi:hypothetical protein
MDFFIKWGLSKLTTVEVEIPDGLHGSTGLIRDINGGRQLWRNNSTIKTRSREHHLTIDVSRRPPLKSYSTNRNNSRALLPDDYLHRHPSSLYPSSEIVAPTPENSSPSSVVSAETSSPVVHCWNGSTRNSKESAVFYTSESVQSTTAEMILFPALKR